MSTFSCVPNWLNPEIRELVCTHRSDNAEETAFFAYHLDDLAAHLAQLQAQDVVKLWFAVKANPLSRVIQTLHQAGFNFDVASTGELQQVLEQGVNPECILNTGPAKSAEHFAHCLSQGVNTFVIESVNQLIWLERAAHALNKSPQVLLRVQLQWCEGEKNPLGGNELTPFGLSIDEWQSICLSDFPSLNVCGLHIFQWGNMLSNEKMYSLWQQMVPPLVNLAAKLGFPLDILDLGGGLGIDYLGSGQTLSWSQIVSDLAKIKAEAGVKELWLELGRYAVAQCGYYVVPVVDRKANYQAQQLVLSAGINHLLRPAITNQPFPAALARASKQSESTFHVHGPLCTSMDKLGELPLPHDVAVGDQLIFGYCGAYGFTESMPFFLCHQLAAEYVIEHGKLVEIRPAQPASSYLY
ncbi:PLP-dependent decarboxylase [Thalassotalea fusca]